MKQNTITYSKIALPIVAVRVRGSDYDHYIDTLALADTGSNQTYMSQDLAIKLNLETNEDRINEKTIHGQRSIHVKTTKVCMSDVEDK